MVYPRLARAAAEAYFAGYHGRRRPRVVETEYSPYQLAALLSAGVASYYLAFTLARWLPFHALLYPVCAACAVLSGLLPGYFFRLMGRRYAPVRSPLFHENNGFLVGLVIALKAAVHFGSFMLAGGPLAGAALVAVALAAGGRDPER
jgi:CDP-diglyceride synthetase